MAGVQRPVKRRAPAIVKGLYVSSTTEKQGDHLLQSFLNGDVDECAVLTVEVAQVDKFFQPLGFAIQTSTSWSTMPH